MLEVGVGMSEDIDSRQVIGFVLRSIRTILTFAGFVDQNRGQYMEGEKCLSGWCDTVRAWKHD